MAAPHDDELASTTLAAPDHYPMAALLERWRQQAAARRVMILGASDPLAACALADLSRHTGRPIVALTPDDDAARKLASDLDLFARAHDDADDLDAPLRDEVVLFPEYDMGPFHHASPDRKITMRRLATLTRLLRKRPPRLLVASARALMRRTLPPESLIHATTTLRVGDEIPNERLRAIFARGGYTEVPVVEDAGTFAIRGDVVDLFSPLDAHPVRLERWGDELTELRAFHPQTQRTIAELGEVEVAVAREALLDRGAVSLAHDRLHDLASQRGVAINAVQNVLADLRANVHFIGIDALLPALHERLGDLTDYLPEDAIIALYQPDAIVASMQELWQRREAELIFERSRGASLCFEVQDYYAHPERVVAWVNDARDCAQVRRVLVRDLDATLSFAEVPEADQHLFHARPNSDVIQVRKQSQGVEQAMRALLPKLDDWCQTHGRVAFACRTPGQAERLAQLLAHLGREAMVVAPPLDVSEPVPPPAQIIEVYDAPVSEGMRSELLGLCLIAGQEIFGQRVASTKSDAKTFVEQAAISHFRDLSAGDYVVHIDFGIGRYLGLVHMDVEGIGNDFLQLEYAGGDKLYVPIYRLGRVQRYLGAPGDMRLDKLGGSGWEKTKDRVKANIRAIAGELLTLYAKRELLKGFAFSPPDQTFFEFEGRFPYEETADQARAITETIHDMTRARPMDRLICGDVGFGKTEVAIRAAMKAVLDGKQVAVLVPTTLLAEQHLISFRERMDEFGAVVECLSRFRTAKEAKNITERAAEGRLDVLIGTHRLLGKEIKFRDLGLLVVDEEQRFGVGHKEKIKRMRANVDVLTMSATPIPRTLQMSLLGIRDLSIIATPPHDRLEVRTHVARFGDGIIREAIMREIGRGGQVFFVHNRVATMQEMANHLTTLIPEARLGIAHGQLPEDELEDVMLAYVRGEVNVLLCSAIIETGLDIPNANTIIINRADMFGLSQLYQLRGRVGRGKERAYAYLLIPDRQKLLADAEKRLDVIQTHTELGSGFHVASYDLEIRGSGSLLGDDQSGHVTAVGLDLYNELLEEAVHDLRGEELEEEIEPEVNIPVPAYIPDEYIPATSLRLVFYKRYSLARTMDELEHVYQEMIDRFGGAPDAVLNLRDLVRVKIALRQMRARRLDAGPAAISIELDRTTTLLPQEIVRLVQESRGKMRLLEGMRLVLNLKPDESARPLETARALVDTLLSNAGPA